MSKNDEKYGIDKKEVLTVREAAYLFGLNDGDIRRWIHSRSDWDWLFYTGTWAKIWKDRFRAFLYQYRQTSDIG